MYRRVSLVLVSSCSDPAASGRRVLSQATAQELLKSAKHEIISYQQEWRKPHAAVGMIKSVQLHLFISFGLVYATVSA